MGSFFQLTISLWMVHFFTIFCSFVPLIFWEAGDRGFDSRTKPQFFYASKSRGETKGSPFGFFFGTMRLFKFYQRVPPCIFWSFRLWKRLMSLNGLFLSFSALCDFQNFFFQIFPIVVPWIFLSLRYGTDLGRSRRVFTSRAASNQSILAAASSE